MSANSYLALDKHITAGILVEIGIGLSSIHFINICKKTNTELYCIDMETRKCEELKKHKKENIYNMSGEDFLNNIFKDTGKKISFCFLDNFDWDYGWEFLPNHDIHRQRKSYLGKGLTLNNLNSQIVHLKQSILVNEYSASRCVISFDDTWPTPDGTFNGKGGSSVPYLLSQGYEILETGSSSTWQPPWEFENGSAYVVVGKGL